MLNIGGILLFLWLASHIINFRIVGRDRAVVSLTLSRPPPWFSRVAGFFLVGDRWRDFFVSRTWGFQSQSLFNGDFTVVTKPLLDILPMKPVPQSLDWAAVLGLCADLLLKSFSPFPVVSAWHLVSSGRYLTIHCSPKLTGMNAFF